MDIKNLNEKELLNLRNEVDIQLKNINVLKVAAQSTKEKNTLSDLTEDDKIFCVIFNESAIYDMDYVKINFYKSDNNWINYSTSHDTKPMGQSSAINNKCMSNHCFLTETAASMRFFTLKPEIWKVDIIKEMNRMIDLKNDSFKADMCRIENKIKNLIENNEVDTFIQKLK